MTTHPDGRVPNGAPKTNVNVSSFLIASKSFGVRTPHQEYRGKRPREASEFSKINFDVGRRAAVVFNREVG